MKAYRNAGLWLLVLALLVALAAGCARSKNDAQLASEVQQKIQGDFAITNKQLGVNVADGVVTLTGTVASEMERAAAANDAAQVEGVRTVVNNLTVADQTAYAEPLPEPGPQRAAAPPVRRSPARATHTHGEPSPQAANARPAAPSYSGAAPSTAATPPPAPPVEVPAGTLLSVRMLDPIDSDKNQVGDRFRATLDTPIVIEDRVVIPANADIEGRVIELASAGRFKGKSQLALELTRVSYSGHTYTIQTNQWTKAGSSRGKRTAATIGGGAAVGAIIGAIAGGGKGAAIGAAAGAGAGTGVQAVTKGEQIRVAPEQVLNFRLEQPVTVAAAARNSSPGRIAQQPADEYSDAEGERPALKRR